MVAAQPFWRVKSLDAMTQEEWESVCDGCGKCCLHKLEDEESGDVFYTGVACQYLDLNTCKCGEYEQRKSLVPDCITLKLEDVDHLFWLPETCAYRLLAEGKPLFDWHPLVSGDRNSVHKAGISVKGKAISESQVDLDDLEEHVVNWVL